MRTSRTSLLIAMLAGALVLSGCGSDDNSGGGGAAAPTTTAAGYDQPTGSSEAGGAATASGELTAKDIAFSPTELSFKGGGQISFGFKNEDSVEHNFTLEGVDGADKDVEGGEDVTVSFTAPAPGSYKFHCEYHPAKMTGTLTVT
jgi:plastocyanin